MARCQANKANGQACERIVPESQRQEPSRGPSTLKRSEISLGSLERRIADLEAFYALESGGGRSGELTRKFVSGFLKAMAHVRRAPIDRPPWGYEANKLHVLSPFGLAQYVAALTVQEHPDEEEVRKILKSKGEDSGLLELIDIVVGHRFRGRP